MFDPVLARIFAIENMNVDPSYLEPPVPLGNPNIFVTDEPPKIVLKETPPQPVMMQEITEMDRQLAIENMNVDMSYYEPDNLWDKIAFATPLDGDLFQKSLPENFLAKGLTPEELLTPPSKPVTPPPPPEKIDRGEFLFVDGASEDPLRFWKQAAPQPVQQKDDPYSLE